ncbi:MAG: phosphoglucosamine mutase [Desulfurococcaceae archaeon]
MNKLFGTDGVRGVVNEFFTPIFAAKLGQAIGSFFGENSRIIVGRDVRVGGLFIKNAVIAGLLSSGVKVYDCDLAPTPAIQYVTRDDGFDGAVIITASHNPPQYNGVKVIDSDGIEISRDKERIIEEIFTEERFNRIQWNRLHESIYEYRVVNDKYVKAVVEKVDKELIKNRGFKIVVDPANSVSVLTTPRIARELGVKVYTINGDLDPYFSGREPEPTVESLSKTITIVTSLKADLGVAHDGDGDRAIFIDDKGRILWGDRSACILAKYLLEKHPDSPRRVYTAVSSSTIIEEYLREYGVEVVWLKVGSVDIARAMKEKGDALCGFEENGGFMYPKHQFVRDGGMTLALMLELLASWRKKLSELYDDLPRMFSVKTKIPMGRDKAVKVIEVLREKYCNYRQVNIDGVKIIGDDYWFLVRPSGTEPLLRVMIEARSEDRLRKILDEILDIVRGI